MSNGTIWLIIAGAVVVIELATGLIFLLIIAGALFAGGFTRMLGFSQSVAFCLASIIGISGYFILRRLQKRIPVCDDINLDFEIGHPVTIAILKADGFGRVIYRGTEWDAQYTGKIPDPLPEYAYLSGRDGNTLLISSQPQTQPKPLDIME